MPTRRAFDKGAFSSGIKNPHIRDRHHTSCSKIIKSVFSVRDEDASVRDTFHTSCVTRFTSAPVRIWISLAGEHVPIIIIVFGTNRGEGAAPTSITFAMIGTINSALLLNGLYF